MKYKLFTCNIFRRTLSLCLIVFVVDVSFCKADVAAEWRMDGTEDVIGGGNLPLDSAPPKASHISELLKNSRFVAGPTGLGDSWQGFLRAGYLDIGNGVGESAKNTQGLVTKETSPGAKDARFPTYLGYSGVHENKGGTMYLVVSPQGDWTSAARRGLMGSGHRSDGYVALSVTAGVVSMEVGGRMYGAKDIAESKIEIKFEKDKWYFIAGSWQGGRNPVLYVREMNPAGPQVSPAGVAGKFDSVCGIFEQPKYDPLVVGAFWQNNGSEAVAIDGAEARIAFARLDSGYAKIKDMELVFDNLGANGKTNP